MIIRFPAGVRESALSRALSIFSLETYLTYLESPLIQKNVPTDHHGHFLEKRALVYV